jgi:hypothetical protein
MPQIKSGSERTPLENYLQGGGINFAADVAKAKFPRALEPRGTRGLAERTVCAVDFNLTGGNV